MISVNRLFFVCKQKTAYDMRISDWSSDVCSSDLEHIGDIVGPCPAHPLRRGHAHQAKARQFVKQLQRIATGRLISCRIGTNALLREGANHITNGRLGFSEEHKPTSLISTVQYIASSGVCCQFGDERRRSEEHTSELQSLMRISYAVFCLKKKKNNKKQENHHN